jgi:NAD(P)-dependent dehydrogenase (short-subunit alcohol dehydrogenase family)
MNQPARPHPTDAHRVAIVTGASRGLGLALTTRLSSEGWTVVVDARHEDELNRATSDLPGVVAVAGDVSDPGHRQTLADTARRLGGLDLLVNNASMLGPSPQPRLADYPLDALDAVYRINVFAPLGLIQVCLPQLVASGGIIISVTSDAAVAGYSGWGGYGSSKAALEQLTNVLASEEPGLSVYSVDPGDMNTQMHREAFPGEDISDRPPPEDSVPGLMRLIDERPGSGRFEVQTVQESS